MPGHTYNIIYQTVAVQRLRFLCCFLSRGVIYRCIAIVGVAIVLCRLYVLLSDSALPYMHEVQILMTYELWLICTIGASLLHAYDPR